MHCTVRTCARDPFPIPVNTKSIQSMLYCSSEAQHGRDSLLYVSKVSINQELLKLSRNDA